MRINQVLAAKARQDVVTVSPDASVRDLLQLLSEHNVGALVVSSDGKKLEGIVSERDVVRRLREEERLLEASDIRAPRWGPRADLGSIASL